MSFPPARIYDDLKRHARMDRRQLLSAGILLAGASSMPVSAAAATSSGTKTKKVYAHWHWFPTSFDNWPADKDQYADYLSPDGTQGKLRAEGGFVRERPLPRPPRPEANWAMLDMLDEIKAAHHIGLDGFLFNMGGIDDGSPYMIHLRNMLEAAQQGPPGFEVILSIDTVILVKTPVDAIADAILKLARNSHVARQSEGRLILGAFSPEQWDVGRWKELLQRLRAGGENVFFYPTFLDVRKTIDFMELIDGASMWGVDKLSDVPLLKKVGKLAKQAGKVWASVVWPQDFRPHNRWFSECHNSELFRASWAAAMEIGSDSVNIATWNDYSEGSEIRPSTSIQYAFYDLAALYIAWFKNGTMPPITEDVLYYFHRIESTEAAGTGSAQPFRFATNLVSRFADPPQNDIELLALLKEPGELTIATAKGSKSLKAKAGITSFRIPLVPGKVSFRLSRGDASVIDLPSAFEIRETSAYQDLLYHGGSSSRPPI
jgi:hypothetical protein